MQRRKKKPKLSSGLCLIFRLILVERHWHLDGDLNPDPVSSFPTCALPGSTQMDLQR